MKFSRKTGQNTINRLLSVILIIFFSTGAMAQSEIPKLSFGEFEEFLHKNNDTTYVINFWATWCAPCIKELPYFEDLNNTKSKNQVKVILVSLDFPQQYDSALIPFINKKGIKSKVLYLDDGKAHKWIPKVDKEWSGAIPATLIYKGNNRKFIEGGVSREELFSAVALITG